MPITALRAPRVRALVSGLALVAAIAVVGTSRITTNQPKVAAAPKIEIDHVSLGHVYSNWSEIKGASTLVVIGTAGIPQPAHPHFVGHHMASEIWTQTPITVERTLLGSASQSLSILQSGQPSTAALVVESDFPILTQGTRYLLFLTPSPIPGQWYPVGAPQGVFPISGDAKVNMYTDVGVPVHDLPLNQVIGTIQAAPAAPPQQ